MAGQVPALKAAGAWWAPAIENAIFARFCSAPKAA